MRPHHENHIAVVLVALVGVLMFTAYLSIASPPQGLVTFTEEIEPQKVPIVVALPVSCNFNKNTGSSSLECNCEERWGIEREENKLFAELSGNWCEPAATMCQTLCDKPDTLREGYVRPYGIYETVGVKRIIADWS